MAETKAAPAADVITIGATLDFFDEVPVPLTNVATPCASTSLEAYGGPAPPLLHDLFHISCLLTN